MADQGRVPPYGILPTLFCEGPAARAIQERGGKDALILSFYLRANRHANMLGLYRLVLGDVLHELPVLGEVPSVRGALSALSAVHWADYHEPTAFVWVRTMVLERLGLMSSEHVMDPEDKRRRGAQRLYDSLPPNPFLEPFHDLYGRSLRLSRRNFAQLDVLSNDRNNDPGYVNYINRISTEAPSEGASEGACQGASEGASRGTSTYVPDLSDQIDQIDQVLHRTAAAATTPRLPIPIGLHRPNTDLQRQPNGTNYHVIARVARELLADAALAAKFLEGPIHTEVDLIEATKRFCAKKRIDYGRSDAVPFDVVHRACASEWLKFRRPDLSGRTSPTRAQL